MPSCMQNDSGQVSPIFCNRTTNQLDSLIVYSQNVLETLRRHQHLRDQDIKTYARKLVAALGDGSTATAEEGIKTNLQFATNELQANCAVLPTLPNGIDLILGKVFLSTYEVLIRPARAECSWDSKAQKKHLVIHGCPTIMPIH
jgi:hypothetical protein